MPSKSDPLREAGDRARRAGDLGAAISAYEQALRLDKAPSALHLNQLGQLLHVAGARARAVACFRKAAAISAKNRPAARVTRRPGDAALVGFTGFHGGLGVSRLNFLDAAGLRETSRVMLWDSTFRFFLAGLPGVAPDFGGVRDFIRARLEELRARKLIVTGASGSGFAALLYGHALGADVVHAFSPAVSLDRDKVQRLQPSAIVQYGALFDEIAACVTDPVLLHVPSVLARNNGKTRFYVHYGRGNRDDRERAHWLAGLPGVELIEHGTADHRTADLLAGAGLLKAVFAAGGASEIPRLKA